MIQNNQKTYKCPEKDIEIAIKKDPDFYSGV